MKVTITDRATRRLSSIGLAALLFAAAAPAATFYFSVDIGGDLEWCDPNADGDEALDPAWIYRAAAGGPEAAKADGLIWGQNPPPNVSVRLPAQGGSAEDARLFFDIDGEDQLGLVPGEPQGPLEGPLAAEPVPGAGLLQNPPRLYYSLDDDKAPGWWAADVPVTASPDRGAGADEILLADGWRAWPAPGQPAADESALGLALNPPPLAEDDDVDALDTRRYRYWFWTCDHEAHYGLDPGSIYVTDTQAAGPNYQLYIPRALLGVPPGTDLDAFEFCVTADPDLLQHFGLPVGSYLAVLFSVDQDDPTTPAVNESGGLNPNTIYVTLLTVTGIPPLALSEREDDVDAIALDVIEPTGEWKWMQPPDLTPEGFDVECMSDRPILLADDFLCDARGAITNIVIWGSWFHDVLPKVEGVADPAHVSFTLSLHADVPAGVQAPWSMPGPTLWLETFHPGMFTVEMDSIDNLVEGWYDPATSNWTPNADWTCWRYQFPVDPARAFVQTGTVDNPIVYWLDVQATPLDSQGEARFGWKTTSPPFRWNDDACWSPRSEPYNGSDWYDLHYPPGHPYHQNYTPADSFDLAFALFGMPLEEPEPIDYGDAPDPLYPTLAASGGACHVIGGPWLGGPADAPDPEPDGQPDPAALGDDGDGNDDENGVSFPLLLVGVPADIVFEVSGVGAFANVEAHVDWNADGDWNDLGEAFSLTQTVLADGVYTNALLVPLTAVPGVTFARVRVSTAWHGPAGLAPDGEVEDYAITIEQRFDYGDAPDPLYPTLAASGGACHVIYGPWLGGPADAPDPEPDGQPDPAALGDNGSGADDENGVSFPLLVTGLPADIVYEVSGVSGLANVECHVDWNADGDWNDLGEASVFTATVSADGLYTNTVTVPLAAAWGTSFARVRVASAWYGPTGLAADGEVEDYAVSIAGIDFGDAPESGTAYPTTLANDGARHLLSGVAAPRLGTWVDTESNGQPAPAADGDDASSVDDEDGVLFPAYVRRARSETVTVSVTAACRLNAWSDWNADGDWADAGEQLVADAALPAGTHALAFTVPPDAAVGTTFTRFRVSTAGGDATTGLAADGEVEDHPLVIREKFPPALGPKWRQPPDAAFGLDLQSWSAPSSEPDIRIGPVVADDWWCDGRPIQSIRWWGSYALYGGPTNRLAVTRPSGFRLSWHLDIPTNAVGGAHSRPGPLLRQTTVSLAPYGQRLEAADEATEHFAGTRTLDFLGPAYAGQAEHTFEYNVVLKHPWLEKHTFARDHYEPPCSSNVYWLSIEALYGEPPSLESHPWGWETCPLRFNWNDAAVAATNRADGTRSPWRDLTYVPPVQPWLQATQHPYLTRPVNLAFEMLSDVVGRRDTKWSQLPHMLLGTDLPSWRWVDPSMTPPPWGAGQALRADDFVSDGRRITDIHWWGSYIGWQAGYNTDEFDPMPAPMEIDERPLGFDLSWHAHDAVANAPGLLLTNVFIPMDRCHEVYYCTIPQLGNLNYPYEHEYQYYVDLLDERLDALPWYEAPGGHYWLNVQAVFDNRFVPAPPGQAGPEQPHEGWGWKIAGIDPDLRLARSVVSNHTSSVAWEDSRLPAWHMQPFALHDLAFELTTDRPRSNAVIQLTAIRRATNGVATVTSSGTGWAGTQRLQRRATLAGTPSWNDAEVNEAPFPPPADNIWERHGSPASNEFYRVIESAP